MTIEEKIAKQIKEARAEKGLTQFQLSEVSGNYSAILFMINSVSALT